MDFNINNADAEREKTLKFAKDNGISTDEVEAVYEKILSELPDDLSDKAKELRALRKTRGSLKRIANSSANYIDGFIFMRFRDNDYEAKSWRDVDEFIKDNSLEMAKEQGMVNDDGEYVHTSFTTQFDNQLGKVINKDGAIGSAVGIFQGDNGMEARFITIGKFQVWEPIPLCRELAVNVKEANTAGKLFTDKKQLYLNGVRATTASHYYTAEDFQGYADMIEEACGDIFFDMKSDIDDYAQSHTDRFNFVAAFGVVNRIGEPLDTGTIPVEIELDDEVITTWASKNIFKDLTIEEGIVGLSFINTYVNGEGAVSYTLGGFLPLADDE